VLLVLDNAADDAQVSALLPGGAGCLTLVTSRRRLVALDGTLPVPLEVLPAGEAVRLLARIAGDRVGAEPDAAAEVVRACGGLPLAIRLAGARLAHRPGWRIADLATRLTAAEPPLAELSAGGRSVAAAFTLSYRQLAPPARQLFRLLGLHPGADFDAHAAAALADLPVPAAGALLEDLVDAHLLEAVAVDRYRFHDLLRDYAGQLAAGDPEPPRTAAIVGLLDYYLHTAACAARCQEQSSALRQVDFGTPSRHARTLDDPDAALAWLHAEWRNLVAGIHLADRHGLHRHTWQLTRAVWWYLWQQTHSDVSLEVHQRALVAAIALGDTGATAVVRNYLASALWRVGRLVEARDQLELAVECWRRLGDEHGEMFALANISAVERCLGRYDRALTTVRQGAAIAERLSRTVAVRNPNVRAEGEILMRLGRYAEALHAHRRQLASFSGREGHYAAIEIGEIGVVHRHLGHHRLAVLLLRRARAMKRDTGNRGGEAETLSELGSAHRGLGRLDEAAACQREALALAVEVGDPNLESRVRNDLAGTLRAAGDAAEAFRLHAAALALAERTHNAYERARAHDGIAAACRDTDPATARRHWQAALALFVEMNTPERDAVAATLRAPPVPDLVDSGQ
jgi:tetratricopeptide (TPR) repeat protein